MAEHSVTVQLYLYTITDCVMQGVQVNESMGFAHKNTLVVLVTPPETDTNARALVKKTHHAAMKKPAELKASIYRIYLS